MKDNAPFLEMPNDQKPTNYNEHFVKASQAEYVKHPCNHSAMNIPSKERVMKGVDRK